LLRWTVPEVYEQVRSRTGRATEGLDGRWRVTVFQAG